MTIDSKDELLLASLSAKEYRPITRRKLEERAERLFEAGLLERADVSLGTADPTWAYRRSAAGDVALDSRPKEFDALRMAGRCRNGFEADGGSLFHSVPKGKWKAVCGAEPGKHSAGWSSSPGTKVTCANCDAWMRTRGAVITIQQERPAS